MNKDEFESAYAERAGVTVEWMHSRQMFGMPCDCDWEECEGWQMASHQDDDPHGHRPDRCEQCLADGSATEVIGLTIQERIDRLLRRSSFDWQRIKALLEER